MSTVPPSLPTTPHALDAHFAKIFTKEGWEHGLAFRPRATDVIIAPFAKCGTTWLQQMAHSLRSRGDMDFDEITNVTPWIENALTLGLDLDGPQVADPRVFKSHLAWHEIPKGARYIVSFRDPLGAFKSFYRFFEGFFFAPGTIDMGALFEWRNPAELMGERGYWYHLASWWEQRHNPNVLLLCYEDMLADLPGTLRRVAAFMDVPLDDALLDIVARQTSREFMLEHKEKYNEAPLRRVISQRTGVAFDTQADKVTRGTGDEPKYQLGTQHLRQMDEFWHAEITAKFGLENYQDLRLAIRALNAPG